MIVIFMAAVLELEDILFLCVLLNETATSFRGERRYPLELPIPSPLASVVFFSPSLLISIPN